MSWGDLENTSWSLCRALIEQGIEVHLVVPNLGGAESNEPLLLPDGSPAPNDSQVYRVATSGVQEGDFLTNKWHDNILIGDFCSRLVRQHGDFDLIHNHDWLTSFAAIAVKHDFHLPLVATIHATEIGRNREAYTMRLSGQSTRQSGGSRMKPGALLRAASTWPGKLRLTSAFRQARSTSYLTESTPAHSTSCAGQDQSQFRLSIARPDEPIVYYVGRLVPEKGLWCLIDAVPLVLRQRPGVKFVLAGGGDYGEELKWHARELGVESNVILPGWISDEVRDKLFMVADCAVFPSLYEPFGMVALEAMAARCPWLSAMWVAFQKW